MAGIIRKEWKCKVHLKPKSRRYSKPTMPQNDTRKSPANGHIIFSPSRPALRLPERGLRPWKAKRSTSPAVWPTDPKTVEQTAVVKVFKEFCPLKVPYVLRRSIAIYEGNNPLGRHEDKIRRDIADSPMIAGTVRYMACPAVQAMVDATALGYLQ
jgi:hypothetical protein